MDIVTFSALLGTVKTATEIAKAIKDGGATLEAAEMKLKLAALISALADVKMEAATVQTQWLDAQERIRQLEAVAKQRAAMVWRQPCYWMPRDGDGVEEAYCQPCYDGNGTASRLNDDGNGGYRCMVCGKYVETNERKLRDELALRGALNRNRGVY
jgi:hypothetical protein